VVPVLILDDEQRELRETERLDVRRGPRTAAAAFLERDARVVAATGEMVRHALEQPAGRAPRAVIRLRARGASGVGAHAREAVPGNRGSKDRQRGTL
jgi:hypothetical protein